jgi:hypothetical protein
MAAVTKGTAHVYGITGTVTNLTVQSYTISRSFELDDKVAGEHGRTITHRMDGRTNEISIEGVLQSNSFALAIGDRVQFTGNEISFDGAITRIEDRGQAKGFSLISISAVSFEDITYS